MISSFSEVSSCGVWCRKTTSPNVDKHIFEAHNKEGIIVQDICVDRFDISERDHIETPAENTLSDICVCISDHF